MVLYMLLGFKMKNTLSLFKITKSPMPLYIIDKMKNEIMAAEDKAIFDALDNLSGFYYYICY